MTKIKEFKLYPWQQAVKQAVDDCFVKMDTEVHQMMDSNERNRKSKIQVSFPESSGHSTLSAYLACSYLPSVLIYKDTDNYIYLADIAEDFLDSVRLSNVTTCISAYQLHHDLLTSMRVPGSAIALENVNGLVSSAKLVVIDNANWLMEIHPEVVDWFYNNVTGSFVLLG